MMYSCKRKYTFMMYSCKRKYSFMMYSCKRKYTFVTVHEKTRLLGHFWENEVATELIRNIRSKPAEKNTENWTALSQTDLIVIWFKQEIKRTSPLYGRCAKLQTASEAWLSHVLLLMRGSFLESSVLKSGVLFLAQNYFKPVGIYSPFL